MPDQSSVSSYHQLNPDAVLNAVDVAGFHTDGRLLALNSYENRVYQLGLDDGGFVVAKFYRPGRWSDAAILEEHAFTLQLAETELPVVAPLKSTDGTTLHKHGNYRFALYPRIGGRAPELDRPDQLRQIGRLIGQIHNIGALRPYAHRLRIDIEEFGIEPVRFLLDGHWLPAELETAYRTLTDDLLASVRACFERAGDVAQLRLHGDCHPGNLLWRESGPQLVDFDDARMGPAIQDLWMFLSGEREYMSARLGDLLEGYSAFRDFDTRELNLIEALRTLRMLHYAAWLARRWDDPAFPMAFPWFNSVRYWQDHLLDLREQLSLMQEPALDWSR